MNRRFQTTKNWTGHVIIFFSLCGLVVLQQIRPLFHITLDGGEDKTAVRDEEELDTNTVKDLLREQPPKISSDFLESSTTTIYKNTKLLIPIVQAHERPTCSERGCLYIYWTGKPIMPTMYLACIESAVKVFGQSNVIVVSNTLANAVHHVSTTTLGSNKQQQQEQQQQQADLIESMIYTIQDWFPTIWNITKYDLVNEIVVDPYMPQHTKNVTLWTQFLHSIQSSLAHEADFIRIALVYLYGGMYGDIDSIWIKSIPIVYPTNNINNINNTNNNPTTNSKSLFRVRVDLRKRRDGKLVRTNDYNYTSNAIVGGTKQSKFYREVLSLMPYSYDPNVWTCIGENILIPSISKCNCVNDFVEVEYKHMYGIYGYDAPKYYTTKLDLEKNHEDRKILLHVLKNSKQLHLFGSKTKADHDVVPVYGSLYYHVLRTLNLTTQVNFTTTT